MRYVVAIVLVILSQHAWSAEVLIGTATMKVLGQSQYQPGKCAREFTELPNGDTEVCISVWAWYRFKAVGFRDIKGKAHSISTIVAAAHLVPSGEWLLVLESFRMRTRRSLVPSTRS
jgi:hypothetical protein